MKSKLLGEVYVDGILYVNTIKNTTIAGITLENFTFLNDTIANPNPMTIIANNGLSSITIHKLNLQSILQSASTTLLALDLLGNVIATTGSAFTSPLSSKGSIYVRDATHDVALTLPAIGANNYILKCDSLASTGLSWTLDPSNLNSINAGGITLTANTISSTSSISIVANTGLADVLIHKLQIGTPSVNPMVYMLAVDAQNRVGYTSMIVSPLTTRGQIYIFDGTNIALDVGTDYQILQSRAGSVHGVEWTSTLKNLTSIETINMKLTGNTLSSENVNGNIIVAPNGSGQFIVNSSIANVSVAKFYANLTTAGQYTEILIGASDTANAFLHYSFDVIVTNRYLTIGMAGNTTIKIANDGIYTNKLFEYTVGNGIRLQSTLGLKQSEYNNITMYVDCNYTGNISNGTVLNPYKTIQAAIDSLPNYVDDSPEYWNCYTIYVAGGRYDENLVIGDNASNRRSAGILDLIATGFVFLGTTASYNQYYEPNPTFGNPDYPTSNKNIYWFLNKQTTSYPVKACFNLLTESSNSNNQSIHDIYPKSGWRLSGSFYIGVTNASSALDSEIQFENVVINGSIAWDPLSAISSGNLNIKMNGVWVKGAVNLPFATVTPRGNANINQIYKSMFDGLVTCKTLNYIDTTKFDLGFSIYETVNPFSDTIGPTINNSCLLGTLTATITSILNTDALTVTNSIPVPTFVNVSLRQLLTTKGDLMSFSTKQDRFPVSPINNYILESNSLAPFGISWTNTPTLSSASIDGLTIATNSISANNTNSSITLLPNGTGKVSIEGTGIDQTALSIYTPLINSQYIQINFGSGIADYSFLRYSYNSTDTSKKMTIGYNLATIECFKGGNITLNATSITANSSIAIGNTTYNNGSIATLAGDLSITSFSNKIVLNNFTFDGTDITSSSSIYLKTTGVGTVKILNLTSLQLGTDDNIRNQISALSNATGYINGVVDRSTVDYELTLNTGIGLDTIEFKVKPKLPATQFQYYWNGKLITKTGTDTATHIQSNTIFYIYYSDTTLIISNSYPDITSATILFGLYYNGTAADLDHWAGQSAILVDERHGYLMDPPTRRALRITNGSYIGNGFGITNITVPTTNTIVAMQPTFIIGTMIDEDMSTTIAELKPSNLVDRYMCVYLRTIAGVTTLKWYTGGTNGELPFLLDTGTNEILYNKLTGVSWDLAPMSTGTYYINYYLCSMPFLANVGVVNYQDLRYILIAGQTIHSLASTAASETMSDLNIDCLQNAEICPLFKLTFKRDASYGTAGTGHAIIYATQALVGQKITIIGGGTPSAHNSLTGRSDVDGHPITAIAGLNVKSIPFASLTGLTDSTDFSFDANTLSVKNITIAGATNTISTLSSDLSLTSATGYVAVNSIKTNTIGTNSLALTLQPATDLILSPTNNITVTGLTTQQLPLDTDLKRQINTISTAFGKLNGVVAIAEVSYSMVLDTPVAGTFRFTVIASPNYSYYNLGKLYNVATNLYVDQLMITGTYYIYYSGATLMISSTFPDIINVTILYSIYYDGSVAIANYWDGPCAFIMDERHGFTMDPYTHLQMHMTYGAYRRSGFAISSINYGSSLIPADLQYAIAQGEMVDEDLISTIAAFAAGDSYMCLFRLGTTWKWHQGGDGINNLPFMEVSNEILYNKNTLGTWSLETLIDTTPTYVNYYVCAMPVYQTVGVIYNNMRYVAIVGQNIYNTLLEAQAECFNSLNLDNFPAAELAPLYKIVYRRNGTNLYGHADIQSATLLIGAHSAITNSDSLTLRIHNSLTNRDALNSHPIGSLYGVTAKTIIFNNSLATALTEDSNFTYDNVTKVMSITNTGVTTSIGAGSLSSTASIALNPANFTITSGIYTLNNNTNNFTIASTSAFATVNPSIIATSNYATTLAPNLATTNSVSWLYGVTTAAAGYFKYYYDSGTATNQMFEIGNIGTTGSTLKLYNNKKIEVVADTFDVIGTVTASATIATIFTPLISGNYIDVFIGKSVSDNAYIRYSYNSTATNAYLEFGHSVGTTGSRLRLNNDGSVNINNNTSIGGANIDMLKIFTPSLASGFSDQLLFGRSATECGYNKYYFDSNVNNQYYEIGEIGTTSKIRFSHNGTLQLTGSTINSGAITIGTTSYNSGNLTDSDAYTINTTGNLILAPITGIVSSLAAISLNCSSSISLAPISNCYINFGTNNSNNLSIAGSSNATWSIVEIYNTGQVNATDLSLKIGSGASTSAKITWRQNATATTTGAIYGSSGTTSSLFFDDTGAVTLAASTGTNITLNGTNIVLGGNITKASSLTITPTGSLILSPTTNVIQSGNYQINNNTNSINVANGYLTLTTSEVISSGTAFALIATHLSGNPASTLNYLFGASLTECGKLSYNYDTLTADNQYFEISELAGLAKVNMKKSGLLTLTSGNTKDIILSPSSGIISSGSSLTIAPTGSLVFSPTTNLITAGNFSFNLNTGTQNIDMLTFKMLINAVVGTVTIEEHYAPNLFGNPARQVTFKYGKSTSECGYTRYNYDSVTPNNQYFEIGEITGLANINITRGGSITLTSTNIVLSPSSGIISSGAALNIQTTVGAITIQGATTATIASTGANNILLNAGSSGSVLLSNTTNITKAAALTISTSSGGITIQGNTTATITSTGANNILLNAGSSGSVLLSNTTNITKAAALTISTSSAGITIQGTTTATIASTGANNILLNAGSSGSVLLSNTTNITKAAALSINTTVGSISILPVSGSNAIITTAGTGIFQAGSANTATFTTSHATNTAGWEVVKFINSAINRYIGIGTFNDGTNTNNNIYSYDGTGSAYIPLCLNCTQITSLGTTYATISVPSSIHNKENITPILKTTYEKIYMLKQVKFNYKDRKIIDYYGFIAEDLHELDLDTLVEYNVFDKNNDKVEINYDSLGVSYCYKDGKKITFKTDEDDYIKKELNWQPAGIHMTEIIPLMVACMKDQKNEIDNLKKILNDVLARLALLETNTKF